MSDININVTNSNNDSTKPVRHRRLTAGESKELMPILYNKFMHGETKQQLAEEYNLPYNTLIGMFNGYILSLPEDEQEKYDYRNKRGRYYAMFMDGEEIQKDSEDENLESKEECKESTDENFDPIIGVKVYSGGKPICNICFEEKKYIEEFCFDIIKSRIFNLTDNNKISLVIYEILNGKEIPIRKITIKSKRM